MIQGRAITLLNLGTRRAAGDRRVFSRPVLCDATRVHVCRPHPRMRALATQSEAAGGAAAEPPKSSSAVTFLENNWGGLLAATVIFGIAQYFYRDSVSKENYSAVADPIVDRAPIRPQEINMLRDANDINHDIFMGWVQTLVGRHDASGGFGGQAALAEDSTSPSESSASMASAEPSNLEPFFPSPSFQGSRAGYVFTTRDGKTGYYFDSVPQSRPKPRRAAPRKFKGNTYSGPPITVTGMSYNELDRFLMAEMDQPFAEGYILQRILLTVARQQVKVPEGGEEPLMAQLMEVKIPGHIILAVLSLLICDSIEDRIQAIHDSAVLESASGTMGRTEVEHTIEGLLETYQVPTKKRVQQIEKRPFETYREIDATEIARCAFKELEIEQDRLSSGLSLEDFQAILSSQAVCAWGECYENHDRRKQRWKE